MASITFGRRLDEKSMFERGMDAWRHVIQVSERTLIDNVAATVPWLAPVSPAYMVWNNAVNLLGWPVWVAWVVALAVEGLGLSVVSTAFSLWQRKSASFWVALITTLFYLTVIITVNVALELGAAAWFAKALLSLLSIPAAVTIALRSQQAQMVEETISAQAEAERLKIEAEQREYQRVVDAEERARRHELKMAKLSEKLPKEERLSEGYGKNGAQALRPYGDWRNVPESERVKIKGMTTKEVMVAYGVSERTATNWRHDANQYG